MFKNNHQTKFYHSQLHKNIGRGTVNNNSPKWWNYEYFNFNSTFLYFFSVSNELLFFFKSNWKCVLKILNELHSKHLYNNFSEDTFITKDQNSLELLDLQALSV